MKLCESNSLDTNDSSKDVSIESKRSTENVWKEKNTLSCNMAVVSTSSNHAGTMSVNDWNKSDYSTEALPYESCDHWPSGELSGESEDNDYTDDSTISPFELLIPFLWNVEYALEHILSNEKSDLTEENDTTNSSSLSWTDEMFQQTCDGLFFLERNLVSRLNRKQVVVYMTIVEFVHVFSDRSITHLSVVNYLLNLKLGVSDQILMLCVTSNYIKSHPTRCLSYSCMDLGQADSKPMYAQDQSYRSIGYESIFGPQRSLLLCISEWTVNPTVDSTSQSNSGYCL